MISNTKDAVATAPPPALGDDAVCFTAGTEVAVFGAGTIHAYLAVDRPAPAIVAGISSGAIAAAAMRQCYVERERMSAGHAPTAARKGASAFELDQAVAEHERWDDCRRWAWFRRYLEKVCNRPFDAIWSGLPDAADFFADHPPIADPSTPEELKSFEHAALTQRYRLVQLGRWFMHLPVRVKDVAGVAVAFVRFKEDYPLPKPVRQGHFFYLSLTLVLSLFKHVLLRPGFYRVPVFRDKVSDDRWLERAARWLRFPRPLFGYSIWFGAWVIALLAAVPIAVLARALFVSVRSGRTLGQACGDACLSACLPLIGSFLVAVVSLRICVAFRGRLVPYALHQLGLDKGVIHDFHLRRELFELFCDDCIPASTGGVAAAGPHPVFVAAPLQTMRSADGKAVHIARQLYAAPEGRIVDAVLTATALPGVFEPTDLPSQGPGLRRWIKPPGVEARPLQLIDGAAIRQNPLPALFNYLRENQALAANLSRFPESKAVHVVYSVPIEPRNRTTLPDEHANVVDIGLAALRLARRCDTQLEVLQTNFVAQLTHVSGRSPQTQPPVFAIGADEIAPGPDEQPLGRLGWSTEEARKTIASGCRRTLRVLYAGQQAKFPTCGAVASAFGRRTRDGGKPGLPEICEHCDGTLSEAYSKPAKTRDESVHGQAVDVGYLPKLQRVAPRQSRIVLVASGGVFRGAFHVGMVGALWITRARPDLIVGASVGTLMGGVVAAMFQEEHTDGLPPQLAELVRTFIHVDEKIALTKTLKTAVRELGLRGRSIELAPNDIRKAVLRGSRDDSGFAATGAPPILIDALSDLLLIPHAETSEIARKFIGGEIVLALGLLGTYVKQFTLRRLGVEAAAMGSSLIALSAKALLKATEVDLDRHQPYNHNPDPNRHVAFFGTTTDLGPESLFWLGDKQNLPGAQYDFVESTLASSAFPFVFSPRRESDLYPGVGSRERRFADGGMFDNLPFGPALTLLADAQAAGAEGRDLRKMLQDRKDCPDLFLVGALNANPEGGQRKTTFNDFLEILERADLLRNNVKIRGFQKVSAIVDEQLGALLEKPDFGADAPFLKRVVNAAVLPIFPADEDHINPTFAFCASLGLEEKRVGKSIANGCFQSLDAFAHPPDELSTRAVEELVRERRIEPVSVSQVDRVSAKQCRYFVKNGQPVACPFALAGDRETQLVHQLCSSDAVHLRTWENRKSARPLANGSPSVAQAPTDALGTPS